MEKLAPLGPFIEQKADDMALQSRLRALPRGGVGLMTDSIADLPDDYKLSHTIATLPMGVMIDGSAYLDKATIQLEQLLPAPALTEIVFAEAAYPAWVLAVLCRAVFDPRRDDADFRQEIAESLKSIRGMLMEIKENM